MHTPSAPSDRALRTPGGLVFGARAVPARQPEILEAVLSSIGREGRLCVFDLDSTLLHNHARQARIVREYGAAHGLAALAVCTTAHVVSWDLGDTLQMLGLQPAAAEAILPPLKAFWKERFFTSPYCADDQPIAGARSFLEAVLAKGGRIVYLTGRDTTMAPGTLESFARAGFPLPDGGALSSARVQLWCKPAPELDDDAWKVGRRALLSESGGVACAFDNEPLHVNAYKEAFPRAAVVHLDTDHSGRPVPVRDDIPSIHDFVRGDAVVAAGDRAAAARAATSGT
jgi:beta-phosphoglucomutase-like phosphatase (HAD superfamily)